MKHFFWGLLLFLFLVDARVGTKRDQEAVHKLRPAFVDAWDRRDGREWATTAAHDVDLPSVATTYLHGRADFAKFHGRLLSGRFGLSPYLEPGRSRSNGPNAKGLWE